jgi:putative redox protein
MSQMKVHVAWKPPVRFDAVADAGASAVMDVLPEHGGTGAGPSPMQAVLMAVAGCTGMDVVSILKKMRAPVEGLTIAVEAERATEHPKIFTKIHLRYEFAGEGLQRDQLEKAVSLSLEKYCAVHAMLHHAVQFTHEIVMSRTHVMR